MQICLNRLYPSILIGDRHIQVNFAFVFIEGINDILIPLFHKSPPELAGPGQLIIIRIECLKEVDEFVYPGRLGEALIGLFYLLLD